MCAWIVAAKVLFLFVADDITAMESFWVAFSKDFLKTNPPKTSAGCPLFIAIDWKFTA